MANTEGTSAAVRDCGRPVLRPQMVIVTRARKPEVSTETPLGIASMRICYLTQSAFMARTSTAGNRLLLGEDEYRWCARKAAMPQWRRAGWGPFTWRHERKDRVYGKGWSVCVTVGV